MATHSTTTDAANAALTLTLSDVLTDLGGIAPERLRALSSRVNSNGSQPSAGEHPGGLANLDDLAQAHAAGSFCELVDGVLVEKTIGYTESLIAAVMIELLNAFVRPRQLGLVSGPDGFVQLFPSLVRGPDVAFISWDRLPGRQLPSAPYPAIVPELVVEVLSIANTRAEMARKRREYFQANVQLLWMVDPLRRSVAVYTTPTDCIVLLDDQSLDGGNVLPGLSIPLAELFAILDGPQAQPKRSEE